jgi:DNA methylase
VTVQLFEGDNRVSLRRLIEQGVKVHSVVCDPPYGLVSVTKRFGKDGAAPAQHGTDGAFGRFSGGFTGRQWDSTFIERDPEFWRLIYDILLPGGYCIAFSGSRTGHWQAVAMEQAGFIMHPMIGWVTGQGFPKAHNAAKAIDKELGVDPEIVGTVKRRDIRNGQGEERGSNITAAAALREGGPKYIDHQITKPGSPEAQQWEGWAYGTQSLKPALEPIYVGQKPFSEKNGALNILKHGVGAINIDATRVPYDAGNSQPDNKVCTCYGREVSQSDRSLGIRNPVSPSSRYEECVPHLSSAPSHVPECPELQDFLGDYPTDRRFDDERVRSEATPFQDAPPSLDDEDKSHDLCAKCGRIREYLSKSSSTNTTRNVEKLGRHPANLLHDGSDEVIACFPDSKGQQGFSEDKQRSQKHTYGAVSDNGKVYEPRNDEGSAARFFNSFELDAPAFYYCPKASKADRAGSKHPTVKPIALMRWLCRLVTPPGGTVLDPFGGSGSTAAAALEEGFNPILMEMEPEYIADIKRRFGLESQLIKIKDPEMDDLLGLDTPVFQYDDCADLL